MFREIRTREKITETINNKNENWKKIRPEREYSDKEINAFWNEIFNEAAKSAQ